MRTALLIVIFCISLLPGTAQDMLYGYYRLVQLNSSPDEDFRLQGCQSLQFNPNDNTTTIVNSAATGRIINYMGLNKNGFLYGIEGVFNRGYNVVAYDTRNNYTPAVVLSDAYWDGGIGSDARTSGMAVDNSDKAWIVGYSVINGNNYLASFQTHNAGQATNFSQTPFILSGDFNSFQVTDIAFDRFGNLYALILDLINGRQHIGFAHVEKLSDTAPGGTIRLSNKWLITDSDNKPVVYNPSYSQGINDSYIAEGLAFSSNGHLLISIDKLSANRKSTNYIYALKYSDAGTALVKRSVIAESVANANTLSYCDDMASNYFPAFLPLTYGSITANVQNNRLQVAWNTLTERSVARFNIEISKNGVNFTNAGSINSLAAEGNSNKELLYNYSSSLSDLPAGFLLSSTFVVFMMGMCLASKKRMAIIFLFFLSGLYACSKNQENTNPQYSGKLFVKIDAVDNNGNILGSTKVLQVTN